MAEWLIEDGIGEQRALLIEHGEPIAARIRWPGDLAPGAVFEAKLASKVSGATRGVATIAPDREVLVDKLPSHITEGAAFQLRITRTPMTEPGRIKRAQGRWIDPAKGNSPPSEDPFREGKSVRRFEAGMWEEIWNAASEGQVEFAGGSLLFSVTPAMTLIDIDGDLKPRALALAAVPAIARWLRLFDLGGSIGIDFPTLNEKADRKAVDSALAEALAGWKHERTAMNGFGFVQLVARLERPSLLHRFASARVAMAARKAMRQAEQVDGPGAILLRIHPALSARIKPEWREQLERATGKNLRIETDPALAIEAPHAQSVDL